MNFQYFLVDITNPKQDIKEKHGVSFKMPRKRKTNYFWYS